MNLLFVAADVRGVGATEGGCIGPRNLWAGTRSTVPPFSFEPSGSEWTTVREADSRSREPNLWTGLGSQSILPAMSLTKGRNALHCAWNLRC